MELVRFSPMKDMVRMRHRMNHLFDDFFYPHNDSNKPSAWDWRPAVDIYDSEEGIVIKAELPGIDKKDIVVDVKGRLLTLKGERHSEQKTDGDKYYRQERYYGKFERAFTLPGEVDRDKIQADFKDGILKIHVPKPEAQKPKQITIH